MMNDPTLGQPLTPIRYRVSTTKRTLTAEQIDSLREEAYQAAEMAADVLERLAARTESDESEEAWAVAQTLKRLRPAQ